MRSSVKRRWVIFNFSHFGWKLKIELNVFLLINREKSDNGTVAFNDCQDEVPCCVPPHHIVEKTSVPVSHFKEVDFCLLIEEVLFSFSKEDDLLPKVPQRVLKSNIPKVRFKMELCILQCEIRLFSPD
ncbi:hypothetical protein Salat_1128200 [Sesamum alatum]|uniref:Uncharacterized protein n=1 Tax=Sesamum alatum TaxID=300844 RepID=A0AAE2CN48_9LAMI|nr:hypothetical protein Salat_1128200 [Sesamum alatum]